MLQQGVEFCYKNALFIFTLLITTNKHKNKYALEKDLSKRRILSVDFFLQTRVSCKLVSARVVYFA